MCCGGRIGFVPWIFFFFNDTATTEIYTRPYTLSLHDALPIWFAWPRGRRSRPRPCSSWRSEEHTSELQSHGLISYAVFCLKKKNILKHRNQETIELTFENAMCILCRLVAIPAKADI